MHTTVFLEEVIQTLDVQPGKKYIDATFGEGGHTKAILDAGGHVLALDLDAEQVQNPPFTHENLKLAHGNYANIEAIAKEHGFTDAAGVVFDLGLSFEQIKDGARGFSYTRPDEELDMRIDTSYDQTAAELINHLDAADLTDLMMKYSEDLLAREIAQDIVFIRKTRRIETVGALIAVIDRVLERHLIQGRSDKQRTYSRIFQALRIMVNHEMDNIRSGLEQALNVIAADGTIVFITFHSLEDRIVKRFKTTNHNIVIKEVNVRKKRTLKQFERSARLRFIQKIA
ncbi:MAG: 16S rRNA (cytosine(1402)-N(4))-methyltransferase RsmH [Weeksellaceae bacterium]